MLNRLRICKWIFIIIAYISAPAMADRSHWQLNMFRGVTPVSKDIYNLHMIAMVVCAIIGVVVFSVMIYSLIHHRKARAYKPAAFHDNPRLEIIWSIIPFLILIGLAIPATRVLIRMNDTDKSEVTIKIVGYQWRWQYQYLDQGISYFSNLSTPYSQIQNKSPKGEWYLLEVDKPLVLPIHKKIRFLVTSNDVIHSWWVPELGIKRDAIPGFMYEAWARITKPGTYRGQCAELCGINHAFMPIVVKAVTQKEFDQWLTEQPKVEDKFEKKDLEAKKMSRAELMSLGQQKYESICTACHNADGSGMPPMYPGLKNSSVATGKPISRHIDMILNGIPGSSMQPYRDQLSDEDIAAITTYERNAWGNNTDDEVQPAEVAALRRAVSKKPIMVNKAQAGGLQ